MSTIAVISNSGLIVFTGTQFDNVKDFERVWYFVLCEHVLFMIKYALALAVPDVPYEVDIQLARQAFIVSKVRHPRSLIWPEYVQMWCLFAQVIENAEDENDEDLAKDIAVELDLTIRKTDDDPL